MKWTSPRGRIAWLLWLCFGCYIGHHPVTSAKLSEECQLNDVIITSAVRDVVTSQDCPNGCSASIMEDETEDSRTCREVDGRCLPVISRDELPRLYDLCLPQVIKGENCTQLSDRVIVHPECLRGEIRDPCDAIDMNVSTLSLRHHWTTPTSVSTSPSSTSSTSSSPSSSSSSPSSSSSSSSSVNLRQECQCTVSSLTNDSLRFKIQGANVAPLGVGARVWVWDPNDRTLISVSGALPPHPDRNLMSRSFVVTFRGPSLMNARQMLIIETSTHFRVVCEGSDVDDSTSLSPESSRPQTVTPSGTEVTTHPVKDDVTHDITTNFTSATVVTFSLKEFFLGVLSVSLFLVVLIIVIVKTRHHRCCHRRQSRSEWRAQKFSVIRCPNPASLPIYHSPQSLEQEREAESSVHHYNTLPHNQKRSLADGATPAYASSSVRPVLLQRSMSLPADTPRTPAPTQSPPPPPHASASLAAIMNHVSRLENIQSASRSNMAAGTGAGTGPGHVTSRQRLLSGGDNHDALFDHSTVVEEEVGSSYEPVYDVPRGKRSKESRC